MDSNSLRIRKLRMQLPDMDDREAESVARGVARSLADALPARTRRRHLGRVSVRVELSEAATDAEAAESIANAVRRALR